MKLATIVTLYLLLNFMTYSARSAEILIVVASPLQVELTDENYVNLVKPGAITLGFGDALKLKYSVDEVIHGSFEKENIMFYDRAPTAGLPIYVTEGSLYIFLVKINEKYILSNIATIVGEDDDVFVCGKMLNPFAEDNTSLAPNYEKINKCEQAVELEELKRYFSRFEFSQHTYKKNNLLKK